MSTPLTPSTRGDGVPTVRTSRQISHGPPVPDTGVGGRTLLSPRPQPFVSDLLIHSGTDLFTLARLCVCVGLRPSSPTPEVRPTHPPWSGGAPVTKWLWETRKRLRVPGVETVGPRHRSLWGRPVGPSPHPGPFPTRRGSGWPHGGAGGNYGNTGDTLWRVKGVRSRDPVLVNVLTTADRWSLHPHTIEVTPFPPVLHFDYSKRVRVPIYPRSPGLQPAAGSVDRHLGSEFRIDTRSVDSIPDPWGVWSRGRVMTGRNPRKGSEGIPRHRGFPFHRTPSTS